MMTLTRAIEIAQLWRAGKMIGADEDEVRNTLLAAAETVAHEPPAGPPWTFDRYQQGRLMAEAITVQREQTFEAAALKASRMADRLDVLVLRRPSPPPGSAPQLKAGDSVVWGGTSDHPGTPGIVHVDRPSVLVRLCDGTMHWLPIAALTPTTKSGE